MPPRHILTHNRKRKAELKSFLLLMKSINANSNRKRGTKSLEKKRGTPAVCLAGNVNTCAKEHNVIAHEIAWYPLNRLELLVMGALKSPTRITILNNGIKIVTLLRHTVSLHSKELMHLSKETDNFFYQDCLYSTISKPVDRMAPMQLITV